MVKHILKIFILVVYSLLQFLWMQKRLNMKIFLSQFLDVYFTSRHFFTYWCNFSFEWVWVCPSSELSLFAYRVFIT